MRGFRVDDITQVRKRIELEGLETPRFIWYPQTFNFGVTDPDTGGGTAGSSGTFNQSTPGVGAPVSTGTIGKGKIGWMQGGWVCANKPVYMRQDFGIAKGGFNGIVNGTVALPAGKLLYPQDSVFSQVQGTVDEADAARVVVTSSLVIWTASADMNYNARFRMEVNGDSNTEGPFTGEADDLYHWRLRNWYIENGNNLRIIDRSVPGESSVHFETYRKQLKLVSPQPPDLFLYVHGTNDWTSPSTYATNVARMIQWRRQQYPEMKIIILGPIPKRGQETEMDAIRAAGLAAVEAADSPLVRFINCAGIWDANSNTYYTDAGIHANADGHRVWFEHIRDEIIAGDEVSDVKFGMLT